MRKLISILSLLGVSILMSECVDEFGDDWRPYVVAGYVEISFQKGVSLKQAFDFAKANSNGIRSISGIGYYCNWPNDSLNYISSYLKTSFFSGATAIIGSKSNRIELYGNFSDDTATKVEDWVNIWSGAANDITLRLEENTDELFMVLYVAPGTERVWSMHTSDPLLSYVGLMMTNKKGNLN